MVRSDINSAHCEMSVWYNGSEAEEDASIGEVMEQLYSDVETDIPQSQLDDITDLGKLVDLTNSESKSYRTLGPGCSVLCRFISEYRGGYPSETGYVGNQGYITPLHVTSVVPGHSLTRISVCDTGSTKLGEQVYVRSYINNTIVSSQSNGSTSLAVLIDTVVESMSKDDILPEGFSVRSIKTTNVDCVLDPAPLTLAHEDMVTRFRGLDIKSHGNRGTYIVPLSCPSKRYKVPCGLGSTLVSNNVVLMYPDVPQYLIPADDRKPTEEQLGFLCCASSATSAALKGLVRYTVSDVVCRCYNRGIQDELMHISRVMRSKGCLCDYDSSNHKVMIAGTTTLLCNSCVEELESIIESYSLKTPHCVTIHKHQFKDSVGTIRVLSFATGTVMRQISPDGPWVDSKSGYSFDGTYRQCVSSAISLVPFLEHINPVRAGLTNVYLNQCITLPCCKYFPGIVLTPKYNQKPCVMSANSYYTSDESLDNIPGLNLFAIFVNLELTYEDGIVMSRSAANRFGYTSKTSVHLTPIIDSIPDIDEVIKPFSVKWWQNHFEGVVESKGPGPMGLVKVVLRSECLPVDGDKFTTLHGQKGVVTILEDSEMPRIKRRYADVVIGSSSIIKRETVSQLLEAACGMYVQTHMGANTTHYTDAILDSYKTEFRVSSDVHSSLLSKYEDEVIINNIVPRRKVVRPGTGVGSVVEQVVRANYGIIRVMQSCFLASTRMSCTHQCSKPHALVVNSKSRSGGSKSLGEMECTQLAAAGLTNCLEEFMDRSDMCLIDMCRVCRCLSIVCVCTGGVRNLNRIKLPYRTVKFIIASKVGFDINTRLYME